MPREKLEFSIPQKIIILILLYFYGHSYSNKLQHGFALCVFVIFITILQRLDFNCLIKTYERNLRYAINFVLRYYYIINSVNYFPLNIAVYTYTHSFLFIYLNNTLREG